MRCAILVLLGIILGCITPTWAAGPWYFTPSSQPQQWTAPANTPRIKITAVGASGGIHYARQNINTYRGLGMSVVSTFYVTPGYTYYILVGYEGGTSSTNYWNTGDNGGGGGGGATFFWDPSQNANPMLAAGGGGGGSIETYALSNPNGDNYAVGRPATASTVGSDNWGGVNGANSGNSATKPGGKGWRDIAGATGSSPLPVPCEGPFCAAGGYPGAGGSLGQGALAGGGSGYSGGAGGMANFPGGAGGGSFSSGSNTNYVFANYYGDGSLTIEVASACDDNSDFDYMNQTCVCRSGYSGLGCQTGPGNCLGQTPALNVTYPYPIIDTASDSLFQPQIKDDSLLLRLKGPYVVSRRYTNLNFAGASPAGACNYVGYNSYWTKTFDSTYQCQDLLTLKMPWSKHNLCQFTKTDVGDATVNAYKGKLQLTFVETMGVSFGVPLIRTTQHSYDVWVYFPTTLSVTLNNTQVTATVQLDIVLTGEQYDPVTSTLALDFTTVTPWSGRLSGMHAGAPAGVFVYTAPVETTNPTVGCTTADGTSCAQTFHVVYNLTNSSSCNFDGLYSLNSTIFACRTGDCSNATVSATFQLSTGKVCASVAVRPSIHGSLQAFRDASSFASDPITSFNLGDRVYFYVATDAGTLNNHVNITFTQITYSAQTDAAVELFNSGNTQNGGVSTAGKNANLFINNNAKYFYMYFSGAQFQIPFGSKWIFSFTAKCLVTFSGNRKREIEMVWNMDDASYYGDGGVSADFGTMIELYRDEAALKENTAQFPSAPSQTVVMQGLSLANVAGIAIGGVVVGVVLVMGVVFSIYKKMQRQLAAQAPVSQPLLA